MDTKLKIILVIFVVLILFYLCYFMFNYYETKTANGSVNQKTKEAFTMEDDDDDVEHYEEPPKEKSTSEYDQRVFILDEIEKLNIDDKEIKGKLMENLFSETTLKKLETMSSKDKRDFINKEHDKLATKEEAPAAQAAPPPAKSTFKDSVKTVADKAQRAIAELSTAQEQIDEIKNILRNQKSNFTNNEEEPAVPVLPSIEGFENVSRYASYNLLSS
jgi:hypothetical protein